MDKVYILAYLNVASIRGTIEKILYSEDAALKSYDKFYNLCTKVVGGFGEYDRLYLFETTLDFVDTYELDRQLDKAVNNDVGAFIQQSYKLGDLKIVRDNCLHV